MSINMEVTVFNDNEEMTISKDSSVYWAYARAGGSICVLFFLAVFLVAGQAASNALDFWIAYWLVFSNFFLTTNHKLLF